MKSEKNRIDKARETE